MAHSPLPIDPLLPEIVETLRRSHTLILVAEAGAGKTTRVPSALLGAGLAGSSEIWVAEPRRIAARLAARRVASELQEPIGHTVGYTVRFEDVSSPATRIRYVTCGVLLRRLAAAPLLEQAGVVVLDEFHERSLEMDLSLSLLRRARRLGRTDLDVLLMSATLDPEAIAASFEGCPVLSCPGRQFALSIEHATQPDDRPLEIQVRSAVRRVLSDPSQGDILVFLPGAREIRRSMTALETLARDHQLDVVALHGSLPMAQQAQAVEPSDRRRVVLSTNVAESSLTINGITAVIDSGLVRVMRHRQHSGLPSLTVEPISCASADQRAGRAGRTCPGRVLRLYTASDLERRARRDPPEILRADLSAALLALRGAGVVDPAELEWIDAPPQGAMQAAESLLSRLGALSHGKALSSVGRRMLKFPVHPRLARIIVEGERRGVSVAACRAAILIAERDIRLSERAAAVKFAGPGASATGPSDVSELLDLFERAEMEEFHPRALHELGLDIAAVRSITRAAAQLERMSRNQTTRPDGIEAADQMLGLAILSGFVDRLAKRRSPGKSELVLWNGEAARLSDRSVVRDAPLMVALDVEYHTVQGRHLVGLVRLASAVEPEWLVEVCPDELEETDEYVLDRTTGRVERLARCRVGSIVLEEQRTAAPPGPEVARLLVRAATSTGSFPTLQRTRHLALSARVELLRRFLPEVPLPSLGENDYDEVIQESAHHVTSLRELEQVDAVESVMARLTADQRNALREQAPEELTLPSGRRVRVHYEVGKDPWIASRLQDFFGMTGAPTLCRGRVPLTLHLLAPNQRAVQVTRDLEGFWQRHYPGIRRQLMRRYSKHAWPEDGRTAQPPRPVRPASQNRGR